MRTDDGETESIIELVRTCEEKLLDPKFRKDRARVSGLLAEDFTEFGASGRIWSREQILDLLETEEFDPPRIEGFACRQISPGVMLATYCTVRTSSLTGDRTVALRSSIWTNESGEWRMRFHQGTKTA
jgi:hypothetical protein